MPKKIDTIRPEDLTPEDLDLAWMTSPAAMAEKLNNGKFQIYKYIEYLDDIITQGILKGGARIVVSLPPRHGKSTLTSLHVPAWFLTLHPDKHVILASYEAMFAAKWGKETRNFIQEHPELGVELAQDSLASDRWNTTEGGGMFTTGIGGPVTGRGGHLIIIDDPIKNFEESKSETIRQNHIDWFNSTLYTRCEPGASIILLMTRWHEEDMAGYLLTQHQDNWTEIRLPAIAEANDMLGRDPGEALCPERYDLTALNRIKTAVGPGPWASLYQQRPAAEGGDMFKAEMFSYGPLQDSFDYTFIVVDTAYTDKQSNDFTCAVAFGMRDGQLFVMDVFRKRIKASDLEEPLVAFIQRHTKYGFRGVYVEPKGHGIYLNQSLPRRGVVVPSETQLQDFYKDRKNDKVVRANNIIPHLSTRKIIINEQLNTKEELLNEVMNFPRAKHDDFVDCVIDGVKIAFVVYGTGGLSICDVLGTKAELELATRFGLRM